MYMQKKQPKKQLMNTPFAFFGTSNFSVQILEVLKENSVVPAIIITTPDKPKGRKLRLTPPDVKKWALQNHIPCLQPKTLREGDLVDVLKHAKLHFFVVASYGKILPSEVLEIPPKGVVNVHPSLLPLLRGPSPIESAILHENETGVSIMLMDEKMDHGPVLAQKRVDLDHFPLPQAELGEILARDGAELLLTTLRGWLSDSITPVPQIHEKATYTKKLEKRDAEISFEISAEDNYRKILAYEQLNPFFYKTINGVRMRIIIKKARLWDGVLLLDEVLPEGRKTMSYQEFKKWAEQ